MADQLLFRGGNTASVAGSTVSNREIVIDTQTNQIVLGSAKDRTVMSAASSGNVSIEGNLGVGAQGVPAATAHLRSDGNNLQTLLFLQNRTGTNSSIVQVALGNGINDLSENRFAYIRAINAGISQIPNGTALAFGTNPDGGDPLERIRITREGLVGIGASSPDKLLHIRGDAAEFKGTNTNAISDSTGTEQVFKFGIEGHKNFTYGPAGSIIFRQDDITWSSVEQFQKPTRIEFCPQDTTTADSTNNPKLTIKSDGTINFANVQTFAGNTEAKAGGLDDGDVYRKSDGTLMIVYT